MKERLSIIFLSIAEILVGILLLVNPVAFTSWIIIAFGIVLVLVGLISVIQYFRTPAPEAALKKSLVIGILAILLGLWCVLKNEWFIALFPLLTTLYGIVILVEGVTKVQWTADMLRLKTGRWGWMALSAVFTLICAVIVLAHPFSTTAALWMFIGITMIVEAIIDIIATIFKKAKSDRG